MEEEASASNSQTGRSLRSTSKRKRMDLEEDEFEGLTPEKKHQAFDEDEDHRHTEAVLRHFHEATESGFLNDPSADTIDHDEIGETDDDFFGEFEEVHALEKKSPHDPMPISSSNEKRFKRSTWTEDEEMKLRSLVYQYKEKNWKKIAQFLPNRTHVQCMQHWKHVLNPRIGRGSWTPKEDAKLLQLVAKYGKKWALISDYLPRRPGKRCRERYINHLCPNLRSAKWSESEESILSNAREEYGNRWSEIAKLLPGRSVSDVKNHWGAMSRRQMAIDAGIPPTTAKTGRHKPRKWTKEEQETLKALVEQYGPKKWLFIASHLPGRTDLQCMQHWAHVINPKVIKGKGSWTPEEDRILIERVRLMGRKWSKIAEFLPGRIGKQCRERYLNHLDEDLNKGPWTPEEDQILMEQHAKHWNKWAAIARHLPGRSDNDVKNRWYSSIQRRVAAGGVTPFPAYKPPAYEPSADVYDVMSEFATVLAENSSTDKDRDAHVADDTPEDGNEIVTV